MITQKLLPVGIGNLIINKVSNMMVQIEHLILYGFPILMITVIGVVLVKKGTAIK